MRHLTCHYRHCQQDFLVAAQCSSDGLLAIPHLVVTSSGQANHIFEPNLVEIVTDDKMKQQFCKPSPTFTLFILKSIYS